MGIKQADDIIDIDPNLGIAFLLALVKNQLHSKMQVDRFDIIDIFLIRIACSAHKADEVSRLDDIALLQTFSKWVVLLQVGIVIIALGVERADTQALPPRRPRLPQWVYQGHPSGHYLSASV